MDRRIQRVDYVIMICTLLYFKRGMGEEKQGVGLGGICESGIEVIVIMKIILGCVIMYENN